MPSLTKIMKLQPTCNLKSLSHNMANWLSSSKLKASSSKLFR